jgi:hypothetical protein
MTWMPSSRRTMLLPNFVMAIFIGAGFVVLQIIVGLLCPAEGCPVAVFEGNTGDPATPGLVLQDQPHLVEPLGRMRIQVKFYDRRPDL